MIQYGLRSSVVGLLIYALLGTSKDVAIGPTTFLSMLCGQCMLDLGSTNNVYTSAMSLCSGLVLIICGFLKLDFLGNIFSIPVVCGFSTATGFIVIMRQMAVCYLKMKKQFKRSICCSHSLEYQSMVLLLQINLSI